MQLDDVIIVGAGPAGLTAALYASRAGLKTRVFEAGFPGGKLLSTSEIENWPGTMPTTGPELAMQMNDHAFQFGATLVNAAVTSVTKTGNVFEVTDAEGQVHRAKTVILATGSTERHLGIPGEEEYRGMGVSYCAVCDGAFFRDKEVVVIGGGNSAFEESVYLTKFAKAVHLVLRRDQPRADAVPVQQAMDNPKVEIHYNLLPQVIQGNGQAVTGVEFKHRETGERVEIPCQGVFPFVGLDPVTDYIQLPVLNAQRFVEARPDMTTSVPGLFSAGDCRNTSLRQIITAGGDGAMAAQSANHYLQTWSEEPNA